jgi:hypothetical protein
MALKKARPDMLVAFDVIPLGQQYLIDPLMVSIPRKNLHATSPVRLVGVMHRAILTTRHTTVLDSISWEHVDIYLPDRSRAQMDQCSVLKFNTDKHGIVMSQ